MALPASDNFTATDGTALTTYSANWSNVAGQFKVNNNACEPNGNGDQCARWNADTFSNNQYAEATIANLTASGYVGLSIRCSASANTHYGVVSNSNDATYLYKYVNGTYSDLGSAAVFAVGDTMRLEADGTTIRVKKNGTTIITVTDSSISSGSAGVAGAGTSTDSQIDNWTAGNLSSGASGSGSVTLAALTSTATGTNLTHGTASATLAALTSTASGTVAIAGSASATLAAFTVTASGGVGSSPIAGAGSVTLDALTSTAAGAVAIHGAGSITLAALTITATGKIAISGASSSTLASVSLTARGYHVEGACIGGVLEVDGTNGRYFRNGSNIVLLSGPHTWQVSGADSSADDPPSTLDFDEWLAMLVDIGATFTKMWAMEQPRNWPNLTQYFAPLPWARTGPGNANDGKLKFDLDTWDEVYFNRLREWTVRLGNAGVYVCVQMFQGWHYTDKGYANAPYEFHPFNSPNNINSVDGDTNNDNSGLESLDTASSVYTRQQAYVRKVIDTINDLDNVIFEVANEVDYTTTTLAWERAIAAYIKSYESGLAKQHPVGITKFWPGGNNAALFASDVEWTSTDEEYPTPDPDATDGSMVVIGDSDHWQGLTLEHEWTWQAFTRGMNVAYMDQWNGWTYGTDTRADADAIRIRNNLGYILDYAARIDLANATPQGSLASTGYCLAKTSGRQQLIAYQPTSGNFTVDLTGMAGTFSVEFLRTSNGATNTGTTVAGGAVRTLTAPWAGEDYVAFLELSAISGAASVTLVGITATATATSGTTGAAAITLAAITSTATATVAVRGSGAVTLVAITSTATASAAVAGNGAATLADISATATAALAIAGSGAVTLEVITLTATTSTNRTGSASVTLDGLTGATAGVVAIAGQLAAALDGITSAAAGAVAIAGSASGTLADITLTSTGVIGAIATGQLDATLDSLTSTATGTVAIAGAGAASVDGLTLTAAGSVPVVGQAAIALDAVTLFATTSAITFGSGAATLGDLTTTATGLVGLIIAVVTGTVRGPSASGTVRGVKGTGTVKG